MQKLNLFLVMVLIVSSCQDSKLEPIASQDDSNKYPDKEIVAFDEHVQLKDGTLHFYSKESFDLTTNYVLSSLEGREAFFFNFKNKGFESVYKFYDNFPEEQLIEISKNRVIPEDLKSFFVLTEENGEFTLENNLQSTFLRLYFNEGLSFYIGNDEIKMEGSLLYIIKDGKKIELKDEKHNSKSNLRATGSYVQYEHNNKDYRLKADSDTRWGHVTLYISGQGYLKFWNYLEYQAHHRKRPWGVWVAQDAPEIAVYGSHWTADPSTNAYTNQSWGPGVLYNTNFAGWYGNYVHSYTYTAYCKGLDGNNHYVTISETKY